MDAARPRVRASLLVVGADDRAISSTLRTDEFYVSQHRVVAVDAVDFPTSGSDAVVTSRATVF